MGTIIGKVGDAIGLTVRGGARVVRAYRKPNVKTVKKVLAGEIEVEDLSVRQFNLDQCVFPLVSYIANKKLRELIFKVWEPLVKGSPLTGANLFVKRNVPRLYRSIPKPDEFYGPTNMPDLSKLLVSCGVHEKICGVKGSYDSGSGEVKVEWEKVNYSTGSKDDEVSVVVLYWGIDKNVGVDFICDKMGKLPELEPWKNVKAWYKIGIGKREDSSAKISIDKSLSMNNSQLVVYVFCSNERKEYSVSSSYRIK